MTEYDIAIVGGGLAGSAAAIALAGTGANVIHLAPKGPPDRRTSALMAPSVAFMVEAGLIDGPERHAEPLSSIRIIDATGRLVRAPETRFLASEAGEPAFGWNFANAPLLEHFAGLAKALPNLTVLDTAATGFSLNENVFAIATAQGGEIAAHLLVGADGKRSPVRSFAGIRENERPFAESALVCDLQLGRPLDGESVEFHYERGPFTLVPAGETRANLVWIDRPDVLKAAQAGDLAKTLAEKSQRLFGAIEIVSPSAIFPLSMLSVATAGRSGVALIGEAAHAFPPIGAQGLNLGLRDVADLVAAVEATGRSQSGWAKAASEVYANRRAADLMRTGSGVEALFRSLLNDFLPMQVARAGGLWALKLLPGLRQKAMQAGMGARQR